MSIIRAVPARAPTQDATMRFQEITEGEYRIYAGALEAPRGGGYIAAVVVSRLGGSTPQREAYRDESVACGHRWSSPEEAIGYALSRARELVRSRSRMLTC
jgi:hypothetical protein